MKTYAKYKDSGIEWIGDIPEHWDVFRLKHVAAVTLSGVDKKTEDGEQSVKLCNYTDVYYNEYITDSIEFMDATASQSEIDYATLHKGDVLVTKDSETPDDIAVPSFVKSDLKNVLCGYHLAQVRPRTGRTHGEFLFRLFCAHTLQEQFTPRANGITRYGIGKYTIDNSLFPLPPLIEQPPIATYLNRKTHPIDTLIEKKQKMIELLKEYRTVVINHAVTKGLNPQAKMKDSGIEWIGKVPDHWRVGVKLNSIAIEEKNSFVNGPFGSDLLTSELMDKGVPVIYIRDIKRGKYVRESSSFITEEKASELKFCRVDAGDVLVAKVGDPPGISAIYPEGESYGIVTQDVIRLRLNPNVAIPQYIVYLLTATYGQALIDRISVISTRNRIGLGDFKAVRIILPTTEEQKIIIDKLDFTCNRIDTVISKELSSIYLLKEYRASLISNAVTGKIDVRDIVTV